MSAVLLGRAIECRELDKLLDRAGSGMGGVAVLTGEAGVGKTALLEYVAGRTSFRIERFGGFASESTLAFAGLHRFLLPFRDAFGDLPAKQREALQIALGEVDGPPPDRFLVGIGTWSLVRSAAERDGLLLLVDDVQWLDRDTVDVLIFVGRRLLSTKGLLVAAIRGDAAGLEGFHQIDIHGLQRRDALDLLRRVRPGPIDPRIADRIVTATGGNPLALTDLGLELSRHQLVGGTILPMPIPIGTHLERHYLQQVRSYPQDTQLWLLIAAAEETGAVDHVRAAADTFGLSTDAARPAEDDGLIAIGTRIRFRHDLIRSAIYGGAAAAQRRDVHHALSRAVPERGDCDRRAWHLASACLGHDDNIAAELEAAANRARDRGGDFARAVFLARAVELSRPGANHTARALAAAEAAVSAGSAPQARALLDLAEPHLESDVQWGRAALIRAGIQAQSGDPAAMATVSATCVEAATLFERCDPDRARDALLYAFETALGAEWRMTKTTLDQLCELALRRQRAQDRADLPCLLLTALAMLHTAPFDKAAPHLDRAIAVMRSTAVPDADVVRSAVLAVAVTTAVWDETTRHQFLERAIAIARTSGALPALTSLLWVQSVTETVLGELCSAETLLAEVDELSAMIGATDNRRETYRNPEFIAWRVVDGDRARAQIRRCRDAAHMLGLGAAETLAQFGEAILLISKSNYEEAFQTLQPICARQFLQISLRALPDLIEAAVRSGRQEAAQHALDQFTGIAETVRTPWALGLSARSRALCANSNNEEHYRDAIEYLSAGRTGADLARTHLLYGEWLRRQRRRRDARAQLQRAIELFETIGAGSFARRARTELEATGAHIATPHVLTPQESAIAQIAATGATNAEIAQRLTLSAHTVDYHLRKVYRKLGITTRRAITDVLSDA